MSKANILRLMDSISDDAAAYKYLESVLWPNGPVCPHCGSEDHAYFLKPKNGTDRETAGGSTTQRRLWKCAECKKKFTVTNGTVMHNTKISLRLWVLVFFEMAASKNGTSAREIERKYSVTNKTAWFLLHRVRMAMGNLGPIETMRGTIVADETWIGGKIKNKHKQGEVPGRVGGRGRAGTPKDKTPVFTLVNKTTGQARSRVVRDVTGASLAKILREHVDIPASVLHTDAAPSYRAIGQEFAQHAWVDHSSWEFVRGDVTSNQAENFFSQLKRSLDGTHHRISREHLPRYLAEFDFRYSTRKLSDAERMTRIIRQADGARLAYKTLKAS